MPCYDPPAPWEGAARRNAESAARLLCAIVRTKIEDKQDVSRDLLEWYLEHREVDLWMEIEPDRRASDPAAVALVRADIERVRKLLL